jgi:siroheme synthase-like protein
MRPLYPLFLKLEGRRVLVVGGGEVAARKVAELIEAGARPTVVAPAIAEAISTAIDARGERVACVRRAFEPTDVDGAWLVIAATDDPAVNRAVADAAEARGIFVNAVDDPPNASAYFGAIVRRAPFLLAISSSGELPALSRLFREVIEQLLPSDAWIEVARGLRRRWKAERRPMGERFAELVRAFHAPAPREPARSARDARDAHEEIARSVVVRPAAERDLDVMARMAAGLVRLHYQFDPLRYLKIDDLEKGYRWWFGKCLGEKDQLLLIAEIDGVTMGYLYGSLEERDWNALLDACGAIHDIWVEAEARRHGVARALIEQAAAWFKAQGAPRVVLHTAQQNERGQAFFETVGFRRTMIEMTREL